MNEQELAAKTEEVNSALETYQTSLQAMDDKRAVEAGERLIDMDCGVCTSIGQHLTGLAVAITTAPHPKRKESIRTEALQSVEGILDDLSL